MIHLYLDETLIHRFKNQISSLVIKTITKQDRSRDVNTHIFTYIFNTFINLQYFKSDSLLFSYNRMSYKYSFPIVCSLTLLELHVKVGSFDDCLYLLDGRFNQLRTFYVDTPSAYTRSYLKINKVCFY